jgi:SAM-dependent methyltransferase
MNPDLSTLVADVFLILLGRPASPTELRDEMRAGDVPTLQLRLLSSPEFGTVRAAWADTLSPSADPEALERTLQKRWGAEAFVRRAYDCLLGRPADTGGLQHYVGALERGDTRTSVLLALVLSEEFHAHYREVAPQNGVIPHDTQLCELANPAKWDNPEWLDILRSLGLSDDKVSMHRKPYEFTQLLYGCRRLGALGEETSVVSVGAGHEKVLYWLANHFGHVVATDMYEGVWQSAQGREGDPGVMHRPEDYAPFPFRRNHLTFMKMDGRRLAFRDATFDVAYSLSSIEHFGGMSGAVETMRDMTRVLKPGGILALATEYVLDGPSHEETFQPAELDELIDQPGLELVESIDVGVYDRYDCAAVDLQRNPYQSPHMVVRLGDTVFTTVMVFLRRVYIRDRREL